MFDVSNGLSTLFMSESSAESCARDASHMRTALFVMPMSTPGRNTVSRNICDVSEPSVIVRNDVNEVSANRSTRERGSEQLEFAGSERELWHKRAVDFSRQPNLSMRGEEAPAFPLEKHQKQHVTANDTDYGTGSIDLQFVAKGCSIHRQCRHTAVRAMKQPK